MDIDVPWDWERRKYSILANYIIWRYAVNAEGTQKKEKRNCQTEKYDLQAWYAIPHDEIKPDLSWGGANFDEEKIVEIWKKFKACSEERIVKWFKSY